VRKIFFVFITVFFIFLLFRLVNVREAIDLVFTANISFIVLATIIGIFQTYLAAFRMKILVSIIAKVNISYFFWMGYLTSLISTALPIFVGGFSFAYFISKKIKSSYPKAFSIAFVDFSFGVLITLVLAIISILYFGSKRLLKISDAGFGKIFMIILFILAISIVVFLVSYKKKNFGNLSSKIKRGVALFTRSKEILIKATLLTLPITFLHFISLYLFFLAYGVNPDLVDFILATSLLTFLNLIPGAIAKIGQYETFGLLTLPYLLNLDKNTVFAALITSHAVSIITIFILGSFSLYHLKVHSEVIKNVSKTVYLKGRLMTYWRNSGKSSQRG